MKARIPREAELLSPVLELFSPTSYHHHLEAPLGNRRIDVLATPIQGQRPTIAIELKVKNWRQAIWQARVNFQIADASYIALWSAYCHLPFRDQKLLKAYGLGLIEVGEESARIIMPSFEVPKKASPKVTSSWSES